MQLNEGFPNYDIQNTNSKDLVNEDITEFYRSNKIYSDESGKCIILNQLEA